MVVLYWPKWLTSEKLCILEWYVSICSYISFNTIVTVLEKALTEVWGAAIINLAIIRCL